MRMNISLSDNNTRDIMGIGYNTSTYIGIRTLEHRDSRALIT